MILWQFRNPNPNLIFSGKEKTLDGDFGKMGALLFKNLIYTIRSVVG